MYGTFDENSSRVQEVVGLCHSEESGAGSLVTVVTRRERSLENDGNQRSGTREVRQGDWRTGGVSEKEKTGGSPSHRRGEKGWTWDVRDLRRTRDE